MDDTVNDIDLLVHLLYELGVVSEEIADKVIVDSNCWWSR